MERRQTLLDILWKGYLADIKDKKKVGDLSLDFYIEVLD